MKRIWSGGISTEGGPELSELMTREDNSIDGLLVEYEIRGLIAYHIELSKSGVLKRDVSEHIIAGLIKLLDSGLKMEDGYEDVHSLVEDKLKEVTPAGSNLRVFLSRNDQSHHDIRSLYIDALLEISLKLVDIADTLNVKFRDSAGFMPGYTHYRQAMPVSISTYFDYIATLLLQYSGDAMALSTKLSEFCPLGYGSGYGSAINVDLHSLATRLGYEKSYKNPVSGASTRGMDDLEVMFQVSRIMTFLSRIAQDFILFSSEEFGFLKLPDGYTTGSSLMPNKRNPDFLEMVQGYASESLGVLFSSFSIMINKETGYHREMQISKDSVISFLSRLVLILEAFNGLATGMSVDGMKSSELIENSTNATMEAFSLFTGGIQWKDAYVAVGNKLRNGEKINSHDPVPMLSDSPELSGELRKAIQTKMNYRNEARDQVIAIARQYFLAQNRQM